IEGINIQINYIRWDNKIGENALYHFLEVYSLIGEKHRENTGFNKIGGGAYGFYHSVYIKSDYFETFHLAENQEEQGNLLKNHNQHEKTYKKLKIFLNKFLKEKRNDFYRLGANKKIKEFEEKKVFPKFADNKYDQERRNDFATVFREIYLLEPIVFQNLKPIQEKSLLGMLNLLLDSNERENVLTIVDGFVSNMDADGRKKLAEILKKTSFNNIVRTIKLIEGRFESIEVLKRLVFDLKEFTNERDHIQKIIENNYWLFGEQFHLTGADEKFEIMLNNYMAFLEGNPTKIEKKKFKVDKINKNRRPDIFLCRQQDLPSPKSNDQSIEENIIVELKRPTVHIGMEQYRQIEDYMNFIINEDQFNSELRQWKFYIIGNRIEKEVKQKYKSFEKEGKKFLVNKVENYEIYAVSWDDLFQSFKSRHKYLLDKLNFDKQSINEELKSKGVDFSKIGSDKLSKLIT
ncbi:MAG: ATP-binding protein, partial [Flavobacteriaceae bacterium]|nr:ATP-binding protein [Flavobacteriaceae bacterium]